MFMKTLTCRFTWHEVLKITTDIFRFNEKYFHYSFDCFLSLIYGSAIKVEDQNKQNKCLLLKA